MAITILPRAGSAGSEIAGQFGQGISTGIQALANMKMQEYTNKQMYKQQQEAQEQQYKQAENALDSIGQGQYKPFVRIPGGLKLMESLALGGWNPQAQQQQGQQPGGIQQTMNALQPNQDMGQYMGFNPKPLPSIADFMGGQQQPANMQQRAQAPEGAPSPTGIQPTADIGTALRQAKANTPEIVAASQRLKQTEDFTKGEALRKEDVQYQNDIRKANRKFDEKSSPTIEAANLAKRNQALYKQIGDKFPGWLAGNLPEPLQSMWIRDPLVREYRSNLIRIAKMRAQAGVRPGKYQVELEQMAKANLNQPKEAQWNLLQDTVDEGERLMDQVSFRESLADKEGRFPKDYENKMSKFRLAQENPLKYPDMFEENDQFYDDDDTRYILKTVKGKKKWEAA